MTSQSAPDDATCVPHGRFSGLPARLVILAVSLGGALLAAEFLVRAFVDTELDTEKLHEENRRLSIGNLIEPAENPEQHYRLRTGLNEEWLNVLVATGDTARARLSTLYPPPTNPAIRIALIGDSSSFGYRVYYEASYAAALRVSLERDFGVPIELRNYSTPGYNSAQERSKLEDVLAEWNPDLVILHYDHNDPDPQSAAPPGFIPPEYGDNLFGSKLFKFAARRIRVRRNEGSRLFVGDDGTEEWLHGSLRSGGPRYDAHLEELRRMGRLLANDGIPALALIYEHGVGRVDKGAEDQHVATLHTPLVPVLEEAGFRVLDLYPKYQDLMRERDWTDLRPFWVSKTDSHPNAYGHAFIAENLRQFILDSLPLKEALESAASKSPGAPIDEARNDAALSFQRSLVLIDLNRIEDAQEQLSKAIAIAPADPALRMTFAKTHLTRNRLLEAAAELEKTVDVKPDFSSAHALLSGIYAHQKRYREAVEHHDIARRTAQLPLFANETSARLAAILQEHASVAASENNPPLAETLRSQAILLFRLAGQEEKATGLLKGFDRFQPNPVLP